MTVVSVYMSPRVPLHNLMSNLYEVMSKLHLPPHFIIAGDFNVNIISREKFMKYFSLKHLYSAFSGVSTNYGAQLDYAFYRGLCPTVHFYESYFSDHKAVLIDLSNSERNLHPSCHDGIISSSNGDTDNNIISIHNISQEVFIDQVNIPSPVPAITVSTLRLLSQVQCVEHWQIVLIYCIYR